MGTREEFSVGGLFGEGSGVYLVNCHYEGAVSGYTRLGGLIGTAHGLNIGTSAYPAPFAVKDNVVELCSAKGTINALGVGQFIQNGNRGGRLLLCRRIDGNSGK